VDLRLSSNVRSEPTLSNLHSRIVTKISQTQRRSLSKLEGVTDVIDSEECLTVYAKNAGLIIADIVRVFDTSGIRLLIGQLFVADS